MEGRSPCGQVDDQVTTSDMGLSADFLQALN